MAEQQQITDLLHEKPQHAVQINNLFQLDVKTDNLKSFLENMVKVVNNQSNIINQMQSEMKTKADKTQVKQCFERINLGVELHDQEFQKNVNFIIGKPLSTNTGDVIDDACNRSANKATMVGHALQYLYKGNKDWDNKLAKLENVVEKKCDTEVMKQKSKKNKRKLLNEIEEQRRKLQKQMDDLNRKISNQINKFEVQVKETEKKTLWKIQDAEALLQKRVTADFVDSNSRQLEEKLMREIAKQKEESFGNLLRDMENLQEKIKKVDDIHNDKNKNLKKSMKQMEDLFLNKLCSIEKFDQNKQLVFDKLNEIEQKLVTLDRRGDASTLFNQAKQLIKELEGKLLNLDREEKDLETRVNELDVKIQYGASDKKGDDNSLLDPHKLCQLESEFKRMKDDIAVQKEKYQSLDNDLNRKFATLEHKVLSNFQLLRNQNGQQLSKEEVISMCERIKIVCEERNKSMQKELNEFKQRMNAFQDLEKKIKKRLQDMANNNEFLQQLQLKADDEIVRREFSHTDEKIKSLNEIVNQTRREFESIEEFYNQLSLLLKTNQQETISVITGNQRIVANRCVACGNKGRQVHQHQHHTHNEMKGNDGKIYKADVGNHKQTSVYEQQEVFDVMPSQIQNTHEYIQLQPSSQSTKFGYGYPSQPNSGNQQIYSSINRQSNINKNRPMSAKVDNSIPDQKLPIISENNNQKQQLNQLENK